MENIQPNSFSLYLKEGQSVCKEMGILGQICQYMFITNYYVYVSTWWKVKVWTRMKRGCKGVQLRAMSRSSGMKHSELEKERSYCRSSWAQVSADIPGIRGQVLPITQTWYTSLHFSVNVKKKKEPVQHSSIRYVEASGGAAELLGVLVLARVFLEPCLACQTGELTAENNQILMF